MEWHNEHASVIRSSGGQILAPSKDNFTLNPLDVSSSTDSMEDIALITDIFSDIYRFSHPQSYMFRNAVQKCLGEAAEREVPTLSSLVRTIESYRGSRLARRMHLTAFRLAQGIWTAFQIQLSSLETGTRTVLTLDKVRYNLPFPESAFTREALRFPQ